MRVRSLALLLILAFVFVGLAGCGDIISFTDPAQKRREANEKRRESISEFLAGEGDVTGETGKTYKTEWFEFTIHSIEKVGSYAGRTAQEGQQLYKVLIIETSTSEETIPVGTFDFYMDDPTFEEYVWAVAPLDGTMMPEEFNLEPGETVQYVMLFEVPVDTTELALVYTEYFDNGEIGTSFTIYVEG